MSSSTETDLVGKLNNVEAENAEIRSGVEALTARVDKTTLESKTTTATTTPSQLNNLI
jgi:hypothetical protein